MRASGCPSRLRRNVLDLTPGRITIAALWDVARRNIPSFESTFHLFILLSARPPSSPHSPSTNAPRQCEVCENHLDLVFVKTLEIQSVNEPFPRDLSHVLWSRSESVLTVIALGLA